MNFDEEFKLDNFVWNEITITDAEAIEAIESPAEKIALEQTIEILRQLIPLIKDKAVNWVRRQPKVPFPSTPFPILVNKR